MGRIIDITARLNGRRMIREVNKLLYDAYLEAATIPTPMTFREFCDTLHQFGMAKG